MEQEKNKNSGLIALVIILCLLLLGTGGYIVYDKVLSKEEPSSNRTTNTTQVEDTNKITTISDFPIEADREGENNVLLNSTLENIFTRLEDVPGSSSNGYDYSFTYNGVTYSAICDESFTDSPGCKRMTLKVNDITVYSNQSDNPLLIVTTDNIIVRATNVDNSLGSLYILNKNGVLQKTISSVVGWYKDGLLNKDTDVVINNNILYYIKSKTTSTLSLNYILLYDSELTEKTIEEFESTIGW